MTRAAFLMSPCDGFPIGPGDVTDETCDLVGPLPQKGGGPVDYWPGVDWVAEVRAWMSSELIAPLAKEGVVLKAALLRFENVLRKPGPAFNYMMAAAAADGADYLYRVNDDTEFVGAGWASQAVAALRSYSPPNVGVVGPVCHEGNTRILTHDLVHRTHLQIFEHYYPPIFSDWWMDDWITHVYGPARTTKGPFVVKHLWTVHGTRYQVDHSHERRLATELDAGRRRITHWLQEATWRQAHARGARRR